MFIFRLNYPTPQISVQRVQTLSDFEHFKGNYFQLFCWNSFDEESIDFNISDNEDGLPKPWEQFKLLILRDVSADKIR